MCYFSEIILFLKRYAVPNTLLYIFNAEIIKKNILVFNTYKFKLFCICFKLLLCLFCI